MADFARRSVADLSGGERQRVALARSLAPRPRLLMLDEPLGALDRALRERLLREIRQILKDLAMTAIFVTHDQSEALAVADRIAVMNAGRLEQMADPEDLYLRPQSRFAASFLGFRNLIEGKIGPAGEVLTALGAFGPLATAKRPGERVTLILRPEGARLAFGQPDTAAEIDPKGPTIRGRVISRLFTGQTYRVKVQTAANIPLTFDLPNRRPPPAAGRSIALILDPASWIVIPEEP
jgi:ABC-type Fe3+/spermidine/putrescine transport system ATPase subunit